MPFSTPPLDVELQLHRLAVANFYEFTPQPAKAVILNDIAFGGRTLQGLEVFVAVGNFEALLDAYIISSFGPGAAQWIERANPKAVSLNAVAASSNLFVAVGAFDGFDNYVVTSPDGTAWTERVATTTGPTGTLADVIFAPEINLWLAMAADGSRTLTSPDGIVWTTRATAFPGLTALAWNGQFFVMIGVATGTKAFIATSPDGIVWTTRNNPKNVALLDVVWNGNIFVAVGQGDGAKAYIVTSKDGANWTEQQNFDSSIGDKSLSGVAWNGKHFVATGSLGFPPGDGYIVSSPDGVIWTEQHSQQASQVNIGRIAWGGRQFVANGGVGKLYKSLAL